MLFERHLQPELLMGVETPLKPGEKPSENSATVPYLGMGTAPLGVRVLKGYNKVIKGEQLPWRYEM